jgi:hypothetical protein
MTRAGLQALVGRAFADGWMVGHAYGRDEPSMSDAAQALTIAEETDAVVEFVARWIYEQRDRLRNPTDGIVLLALADVWLEEMGTDANPGAESA